MVDNSLHLVNNKVIEVATPLVNSVDEVPQGDSFVFEDIYNHSSHIDLLKERQLIFKNLYTEQRFERLISLVGYYALSQYFKHFYIKNAKCFKPKTEAQALITAYRQNERLRLLLVDVLFRIELRIRTLVTEKMIIETQDPYWCYSSSFSDLKLLKNALQKDNARGSTNRYKHQATRIFFEHYPTHD